ncbi:DUF3054 domain-containing protein [Microbacterium sediminis]|uniref:Uncharacterized protein n=1 Tax=Microbacterium sediminis TaxID=904291 RepID=A0A1B9NDG2_9MICO|nr:DUF3054 domain-containing protein [Microbacterium sediminis]OCG74594.1 hypothetical protein A7J15_03385 [Microbacterium sediminis]QBR74887.1 DUF3054 domain-containing protein [Microbacterium sediminis]
MTRFPWPAALAIDAVLVIAFAAIGMVQHHGGFTAGGLIGTAWPFLAALAVGWLVALAWRAPARPLRTGLPVWAVTVAGGMILRAVTGGGTAVAFVIVAAVTLLVFLVGWRLIAALVARTRRRG